MARTRPLWLLTATLCILAWGGLIYATAVVPRRLPQLDIPSLCGPWGCTAEPNNLVAYHLVWIAVTFPAAVLVTRVWATPRLRRTGLTLMSVVAFVVLGTLFLSGTIWRWQHPDVPLEQPWRYGLYLLFRNADWPVCPAFLVGLVFAFSSTKRIGDVAIVESDDPTQRDPSPE